MFVVGGESLIDLVQEPPQPDGTIRMSAHQGGSPYNCAIALSKLGNDTGFLCPISEDTFGSYLLVPLAEAGVTPLLEERVAAPTTLAVVTFNERMSASYAFYRSADHAYTAAGLSAALPANLEVLQFGGFTTIEPQDAAIWIDVVQDALARGVTVTMDPNMRPSLVHDFVTYSDQIDRFFDLVHLVKVSIEDLLYLETQRVLDENQTVAPEEREALIKKHAFDILSRRNAELVVITFGEDGSRAIARDGGDVEVAVYAPPVFVDTVGAGDSLMAGILTWLSEQGRLTPGKMRSLTNDELEQMLRFGAVVAGLNCGQKGCNPPSRAEVDAVLSAG